MQDLKLSRKMKPSEFVQTFMHLGGKPFSIKDYPYLPPIYDSNAREMGLFTGRQVSKSTYLASSMTAVAATTPHGSQVLVTPLQDQAFVFSTQRLTDFLERSPVIREGFFTGGSIINQTLKKRLNNDHLISLGYAQRTADRLRGQSVKTRLNYDEVQDIFPEVIPVINELAFRYPDCRFLYSGTPKSRQNHMEAMRNRSTACEWAVKCQQMGCGHWNHDWDESNIGETGVVCAKCRKPLNSNLGQWVARRRYGSVVNNVKILMETYRISQLIVKPIMDHPVKWDELITKLRTYPNAQFRNEVLGLSADCGTQPITREQLVACCQTNRRNELPDRTNPRLPQLVMGVDWAVNGGANAGNSLTAVVIGGWDPFPSCFQVYFARVFRGIEAGPNYEIDWIKRHFVSSGCRMIAADWGSGQVQNLQLINALGEANVAQLFHTGMGAGVGGAKMPRVKWEPRTRKYHLARTRVLTDTFETARMKQLVLPRAEEIEDLITHFLAEAMEYNDKSNTQKYVNAEPDDLLHAVTYAMIGGELLERGDFMGHAGSQTQLSSPSNDAWNEEPEAVLDSYYQ